MHVVAIEIPSGLCRNVLVTHDVCWDFYVVSVDTEFVESFDGVVYELDCLSVVGGFGDFGFYFVAFDSDFCHFCDF